jgi:hypothetical protein
MSKETDYISYLETKICDLDNLNREMETVLMLMLFSEASGLDKNMIYNIASRALWRRLPFSEETIRDYKKLLDDLKA